MSEKQEFEKYPALTEIIQHFACHVPVRLDEWTTLLAEINNALEAAAQPPAIDLEKIPFDPNRLNRIEGHEERAQKSWEEIQKRLADPPAVKGGMPRLDQPILTDEDMKAWEQSEAEERTVKGAVWVKGEYELAFIPCASDDPRRIGAYQSTDGESEFSVRELHLPVEPKGAVWVKASDRLPLTHGPYCIQFNNEYFTGRFQAEMKRFILPDGSTPSLAFIEWLDANIGAQMPDSTTRVYDLELVLYRLMKAFEKTQRTGLQEKRYKEATDVLNKNFNPASVLRDESPTAAGDGKEAIKWVKASEFKAKDRSEFRPYRKKGVHEGCEFDYGEIYIMVDGEGVFFEVDQESGYFPQADERWDEWEILCESPFPAANGTEVIAIMLWAFTYIEAWDKKGNEVTLFNGEKRPVSDLPNIFKHQNK